MLVERLNQQKPGNFAYLRRLAGEQGADGCLAFKAAVKETHCFRKSTREPAAAEELEPLRPWGKLCVGGVMGEKEHRLPRKCQRQLRIDGETEAGSCMGVLIVSSEPTYFLCKLMQTMIWFGPFTMPDCVPEDRNRKARASAQPEHRARVRVSCGGSGVPLPVCSPAQLDFSPASAKRRASLRPGNALGRPS